MMYLPKKIPTSLKCLIIGISLIFGLSNPARAQNEPHWMAFGEAITMAETTNRFILVDVWAPWCGWCYKMKKKVYPQLSQKVTNRFVFTRLNRDETKNTLPYKGRNFTEMELAQMFNTETVPAVVILNPQGEYLLHFSGFVEAERLQSILESISSQQREELYSGSSAM